MPPARRDLLKAALAAPALLAGHAFAAPAAGGNRLLVVFLRGAYDAANIIAPVASDFYHQARPTLALARPDPANADAALPLDADWGLHPALKDSILPLWQAGQIAFVPFAGTEDMSRSHFETQDTIELGQPLGATRDYGSGFMARLAGVLGASASAIAFTEQLPLVFRGGAMVPNIALAGNGKPALDARQAGLVRQMYAGQHLAGVDLAAAVDTGFAAIETLYGAGYAFAES